jgi:hypothetical protein
MRGLAGSSCFAALVVVFVGACSAQPPGGGSGSAGVTGAAGGGSGSAGAPGAGANGASGAGPGRGAAGEGGGAVQPSGGEGGASPSGAAGSGGSGQVGAMGGTPAEMPDAAAVGTDALGDAGPTSGCEGLFCEDFEKGIIDPGIWDVKVNGGQSMPDLVTQVGLVAHGKYAAHFHANPNTVSYDFMITRNPPAALKGHHFGRAYFMITPMPPTNHTEYIFAGTTGFPELKYLEVASAAPLVWQLTYVTEVPPGTGEDYHSGGKVPIGQWFCLEWEFNDAPDQAAVYQDGNATAAFAQNTFTYNGATAGLVGGFAAFGFGYYAWHPATYAFDVYYDDIVLDTKRVGCLK